MPGEENLPNDPIRQRINQHLKDKVYKPLNAKPVRIFMDKPLGSEKVFSYGNVLAEFTTEKTNRFLDEAARIGKQLTDERIARIFEPELLKRELGPFIKGRIQEMEEKVSSGIGKTQGAWSMKDQDLQCSELPKYRDALEVFQEAFPEVLK